MVWEESGFLQVRGSSALGSLPSPGVKLVKIADSWVQILEILTQLVWGGVQNSFFSPLKKLR